MCGEGATCQAAMYDFGYDCSCTCLNSFEPPPDCVDISGEGADYFCEYASQLLQVRPVATLSSPFSAVLGERISPGNASLY